MDLQNLRAFRAVAQQGSFSRAAEILHITQPAVSKRIALLEQELGQQLFDRIGRQIVLTEPGSALLVHAERVLQEVADARRALANLSGVAAGKLSIATSHHIGLHHLPDILSRYRASYPAVELDIRFTDSELAHEAILSGDIELGVITLPPEPESQLCQQCIWPDPLQVVCARSHPLASASSVQMEDLVTHDALLPSRQTFTRRIVEERFRAGNLDLRVTLSTNYLETIKVMTSVGLGWSILPATLVDDSLHMIDIPELHLQRELGYVTHRSRTLSNAGRALVAMLDEDSGRCS